MTSASSYKQADVKKTKAEQRNHGNSEKSKTREQMNTEQQNFKTSWFYNGLSYNCHD